MCEASAARNVQVNADTSAVINFLTPLNKNKCNHGPHDESNSFYSAFFFVINNFWTTKLVEYQII